MRCSRWWGSPERTTLDAPPDVTNDPVEGRTASDASLAPNPVSESIGASQPQTGKGANPLSHEADASEAEKHHCPNRRFGPRKWLPVRTIEKQILKFAAETMPPLPVNR